MPILAPLLFVCDAIPLPAGKDRWQLFLDLFEMGVLFKMLCALVDTPLFYAAVGYLKPRIGDESSETN